MDGNRTKRGPFGTEGLVEVATLLDISDKLAEAKYFLGLMKGESAADKFRWLTSACLNSCRSALDWIGWNVCHAKETEEGPFAPDEHLIDGLQEYIRIKCHRKPDRDKAFVSPVHPLLVQLSAIRQEAAHRSANWIDRLPAVSGEKLEFPGDEFAFVWVPPVPDPEYLQRTVPQGRVVPFCRLAIELIEEIHREAHRISGPELHTESGA